MGSHSFLFTLIIIQSDCNQLPIYENHENSCPRGVFCFSNIELAMCLIVDVGSFYKIEIVDFEVSLFFFQNMV